MVLFAKWLRRAAFCGLLLLWVGCAGKNQTAAPASGEAAGALNELKSIDVSEQSGEMWVAIAGAKALKPNVFKLTEPFKIIVDLPETTLGGIKGPIAVNNEMINEITTSQFDDANSSLSRVVIGLNRPADYQVVPEGEKLTIKIPKAPAAAENGNMSAPQATPVPEAAAQATPEAQPPAVAAEAAVPPPPATPATKLIDVKTQEEGDSSVYRFVADGNLDKIAVDDFILPNPTRLVIDMGGIKNAYSGGKMVQGNGGVVNSVRLGEHENKLRLVFDLKADKAPSYTINRQGDTLAVSVVKVASAAPEVAAAPPSPSPEAAASAAPDLLEKEVAKGGTPPAKEEAPPTAKEVLPQGEFPAAKEEAKTVTAEEVPPLTPEVETAPALAPAEKEKKETPKASAKAVKAEEVPLVAEEKPTAEATPAEAASPPAKKEEPAKVAKLEFRQVQDKESGKSYSRILVRTDKPVSYEEREEGEQKIAFTLDNTKIGKKLSRHLDTSEFQSPVKMITSFQTGKKTPLTHIVVELREKTSAVVKQEGNELTIDFERTLVAARAPTKEEASAMAGAEVAKAAPAAPPAGEEALPLPEEGIAPEEKPAEEAAAAPKATPHKEAEMSYLDEAAVSTSGEDRFVEYAKPKTGRYSEVTETVIRDTQAGPGTVGSFYSESVGGKKVWRGKRINLNFKNADIRSIFRLLADISKLNIILSDDVNGTVTVRILDVPWDQAMSIILESKGLGAIKVGNIIRIAPAEQLKKEREMAAAARKAAEQAEELELLLLPVSYATAQEMSDRVKTVLSERGTVDVDTRTNTMIIRDIRASLEKAKALVKSLDTQTPQVNIEARIVEASTSYTRTFGIQWGGKFNFGPNTGNPTGVFFPNNVAGQGNVAGQTSPFGNPVALNYPSPLAPNAAMALRFGSINGILDLDLQLGLLESTGQGKILSSPKVTVLDNKPATILSGTKIPFVTQTNNSGSNVRFESAVISLTVTPHVTADGSVFMEINATRNSPDFGNQVQGNPTIQQREATTQVLVKSGNTTVIGGVYQLRKDDGYQGFPGLSSIPVLGWLFRNYNKVRTREELLIFVTPRIVGDERRVVKDIRG